MNYLALATRPIVAPIPGSDFYRVTGWTELGLVKDLAEAKAKFGGSPVLQRVKPA